VVFHNSVLIGMVKCWVYYGDLELFVNYIVLIELIEFS